MPRRAISNDDFLVDLFKLICRDINDKTFRLKPCMRGPSSIFFYATLPTDILKLCYSVVCKVSTKQKRGVTACAFGEVRHWKRELVFRDGFDGHPHSSSKLINKSDVHTKPLTFNVRGGRSSEAAEGIFRCFCTLNFSFIYFWYVFPINVICQ